MPLMVDGGRVPPLWAERVRSLRPISRDRYSARAACVRIAFVNNMPDSALEDTELQFFELLETASTGIRVCLKLYSLPGIPRGDRGKRHLDSFYYGIHDLSDSRFDSLIMTGTEPFRSDLREEAYWSPLVSVLDWAERSTVSAVLSCLAAHAAVLHSDGIARHALDDKRFGVFDCRKVCEHVLTSRTANLFRFPHSRWNEVREDDLASAGYTVLTRSEDAAVDLFVKNKRRSLFAHFQGHPEYSARTLLKEYRRDIRRFLRQERETYPSMPRGYFDAAATGVLEDFRERALSQQHEDLMCAFPESAVSMTLQNTWQSSALSVYRNWLQYVVSRKAGAPRVATMPAFRDQGQQKSSLIQ
jgi:homoserine O-succinyltransferase/O-acetyltransferase